jgi:hypothetical protein
MFMSLQEMPVEFECSNKELPQYSELGLNPGFRDKVHNLCILLLENDLNQ